MERHCWIEPPDGDRLAESFDILRLAGVRTVASLASDDEVRRLGLEDESTVAREAGIDVLALPTATLAVPEPEAFRRLVESIRRRLDDGQHVAVHCGSAEGDRSSLVAAAVLLLDGVPADEAWDRVTTAFGALPSTARQRAWVSSAASTAVDGR